MAVRGFDFFITYKRERYATAKWLADGLKSAGFTVWWDAKLVTGSNFITIINEVILSSKNCVVLWDSAATRSDHVLSEAAIAQRIGTYKPFLLEAGLLLPSPFTISHADDLSDWESNAADALQRVQNLATSDVSPETAAETEKSLLSEIQGWVEIEKSRDEASFRAYLERHGTVGIFGALAQHRLEDIASANSARSVSSVQKDVSTSVIETFVPVTGGIGVLGTPEDETTVDFLQEAPQRRLTIPPFKLSKNLVTFAEFDAFCDEARLPKPDDCLWGRGEMPVINVSKVEALQYCDWLSDKTGMNVRLPSEAEWEYSARAGRTNLFAWGDAWEFGVCNGASEINRTSPVGSFSPNGLGFNDMIGNVWELCADTWSDDLTQAPANGRALQDPHTDATVIRGGAWDSSPVFLRPAMRWSCSNKHKANNIGFRVATDAEV